MARFVVSLCFGLALYAQCLDAQWRRPNQQQNPNKPAQPGQDPYFLYLRSLCVKNARIPENATVLAPECIRCFNESLPCIRGQVQQPTRDFARAQVCLDTFLGEHGPDVRPQENIYKQAFYICLESLGQAQTVNACLIGGLTGQAFVNCTNNPPRTTNGPAANPDAEVIPGGPNPANAIPNRQVRPGGRPVELPGRPPFQRQGRSI